MSKGTNCIVLYGDFKSDKIAWKDWLGFISGIAERFNIQFSHIGVSSEKTFKSGSIVQLKRGTTRLNRAIEDGEKINTIEFYSLPSEFRQAAFDYEFHAVLTNSPLPFVYLANVGSNFENDFFEDLKQLVSGFFKVSEGLLFSMDKYESPYFFASKMNQPSSYKSLKVFSQKAYD